MHKMISVFILVLSSACAHAVNTTPDLQTHPDILYIGDSYSQGTSSPGATLEPRLGGTTRVLRYAMVGAAATDYQKEEVCPPDGCRADYSLPGFPNGMAHTALPATFGGLSQLIDQYQPKTVVIELGTNDTEAYCDGGHQMIPAAAALAAAARDAGAVCNWIGPISFLAGTEVFRACGAQYNEYVQALRTAVEAEGCHFVDMRRAGNTARSCPSDNPNFLEPDPTKNCSLQPTDHPGVHFRTGDPQIAMWAAYAAKHVVLKKLLCAANGCSKVVQ